MPNIKKIRNLYFLITYIFANHYELHKQLSHNTFRSVKKMLVTFHEQKRILLNNQNLHNTKIIHIKYILYMFDMVL